MDILFQKLNFIICQLTSASLCEKKKKMYNIALCVIKPGSN